MKIIVTTQILECSVRLTCMGGVRGMNKKRCVLLAMCMVLKMRGQKKYPRL